jgi:hypothetical protein
VTVALLAAWNLGEASDRPTGTNCNLATPPAASGEDSSHGIAIRVYPRAKDIGPAYTGCQVVWAQDREGWVEIAVTEIDHGDPVSIWSADQSDARSYSCRYRHGRVVSGDGVTCVDPQSLIAKSMAPGCVAKMSVAVANGGPTAQLPQACEYE